nr:MAG TPA: hypothetical protein [Caudoviricetes sp.]
MAAYILLSQIGFCTQLTTFMSIFFSYGNEVNYTEVGVTTSNPDTRCGIIGIVIYTYKIHRRCFTKKKRAFKNRGYASSPFLMLLVR